MLHKQKINNEKFSKSPDIISKYKLVTNKNRKFSKSPPRYHFPSTSQTVFYENSSHTLSPTIGNIRTGTPFHTINKTYATTTVTKIQKYKSLQNILNQFIDTPSYRNHQNQFISYTKRFASNSFDLERNNCRGDFLTDDGFKFKPLIPLKFIPIEQKGSNNKRVFIPGNSNQDNIITYDNVNVNVDVFA